jgi:UPF0755 protein
LKKNTVRIAVFFVALGALALAAGSLLYFLRRSTPGGGGVSLGLCNASSLGDLGIGAYLDAHAVELEQPAGSDETPVTFVIESGETAIDIAARLEDQGLVSDGELFRRYVQYHGLDAGIEAGTFTLRQTMTIPEIALALQQGRRPERVLTLQEGLRLEQAATVVASQMGVPRDEFLALVTTGWQDAGLAWPFLGDLPAGATLEGYLFPDTYRLPEEASSLDVLNRLLETYDSRVTSEMRAAVANQGLTAREMMILASIVEREAVLAEERPLIAAVYHNRLKAGWFLNADPTIQYAIGRQGETGDWWPVLTLDDLEFASPYNTYRNLGLPPGPICSPGLASIQAVAYPAETDYFFFLADCEKNDGSHLFAVTEEEHLANYWMCGGGSQ